MVPYHAVTRDGKVTFTFQFKGYKPCQVTDAHPNYEKIKARMSDKPITISDDELLKLCEYSYATKKDAAAVSGGKVEFVGGRLTYGGVEIHTTLAVKIKQLADAGLNIDSLLLFAQNLYENPSFRSRNQLYDFIDKYGLPITDDGHFLMYKAVTVNWLDKHTKRIRNMIGDLVKEDRGSISDDPNQGCHFGLHCGALEYVNGFKSGDDRIVLVKVNPRDVVCVPYDSSFQKIRVCEYVVVDEYKEELKELVYTQKVNGNGYEPVRPKQIPVGVAIAQAIEGPDDDIHDDDEEDDDEYDSDLEDDDDDDSSVVEEWDDE
jgi:hypothetical protein